MNDIERLSKNLGTILSESLKVSDILRSDIERLMILFEDDWSDQFFRRLFIRAYWAMIEGQVYGIKQITLHACILGSKNIEAADHIFLSESEVFINSDGKKTVKPAFKSALTNIKKTFKVADKYFEVKWLPDFNSVGWQKIQNSINSRNEITHPKSFQSLVISDEFFQCHKDACMWFIQAYSELYNKIFDKYIA